MILAILWILEILVGILLVLSVLVQVGRGESIGTIFGGGPQAILGPRGATTVIEKGTFILIGLFFIITLAISKLSSYKEFVPAEKLPEVPAAEEVLPQPRPQMQIEEPKVQQGVTSPDVQ